MVTSSADLLTAYELCDRKGVWSGQWRLPRLTSTEMLQRAIRVGLTTGGGGELSEVGQFAGDAVMELAANPGLELPSGVHSVHQSAIHHAYLADILTQAIRKPTESPWAVPEPLGQHWTSSALLSPSGTHLRRVVLVSAWNADRHYEEVRSWYGIGEVAMYRIPMQMIVLVVGRNIDGRRSSPWTRGFLHPQNHKLRFRKKSKSTFETFSDKWEHVWREDRDEIEAHAWMQAMLDDDILRDVCFTVDIKVPSDEECERITMLGSKRLDSLRVDASDQSLLPQLRLSTCSKCQFLKCCWSTPAFEPSEKSGYVRIGE